MRILHLEDDLKDRDLVRLALARAGVEAELVGVTTLAEFQGALQHGDLAAIFADMALPGFDGMAALDWARAHRPEVPFLFVSGTISAARAIETLRRGATDYVLKHELERLAPALERAVREAAEHARRRSAEDALRTANDALKTSESFLQSLVENLPVIIYRKDTAGRLTFANRLYCERRGKPLSALLGLTDFDLSPPEIAKKVWADTQRVMETRQRLEAIEPQIRPNGTESWIHIIKVPIIDDAGQVVGTQGMYWDVTERIHAEQALRKSEERFREMAETIRDVFWSTSPDGRTIHYVSPAYESIWGRPLADLYARPTSWIEGVFPEDRDRVIFALEGAGKGIDYRIEYRVAPPDGSTRWVEDRGYPVRDPEGKIERMVGVVTNITERKQLEADLLHAQKMEAIGQLAGGVAHDFNNVMTVITGYANLLLDTAEHSPETRESLKQIYVAGERAASLTRQLLVFSRKQRIHLQILDLNDLIDNAGKLLRRLIGEHISLEIALASRVPLVEADPNMIEQVLMNLAVNARDAMPKDGQLRITTKASTLSEADAQAQPGARAGDFVCIAVSDTGCGIAPGILPRIFEPFFTTKEPGKGTGLGLATVFGVTQQHHGWVTVESKVGAGTTFRVFLPVTARGAERPGAGTPDEKPGGGSETILVVEDEAAVRDFAAAVLQKHGYRVLRASDGPDALEVWKWHGAKIALVLTDMVMPRNMTGLELAKKLRAEKPGLAVICTSGYSGDTMAEVLAPPPGVRFLHKPYQPRGLAKAVRDALDRAEKPPTP